jgi:hypothetical protein
MVWLKYINKVNLLSIPRCYAAGFESNVIELHTFVDSSEVAYAALSYFRFVNKENNKVVLIAAKTKVAPKKLLTIPRLELQSAVLGTRLVATICNGHSIKITRKIFLSDSTTVLQWIHSDARNYKVFVAHRITEILESSKVEEWRWVPTCDNVADEATKWSKYLETNIMESRWHNGPQYLHHSEENWPKQ